MKQILFVIVAILCTTQVLGLEVSEIMYNPAGTDSGREWVEIYSPAGANLSGIRFYDNEGTHVINVVQGSLDMPPGSYAIICDDETLFLQDYPEYTGILYSSYFSLSNIGEEIGLFNTSSTEILDSVTYTNEYANGNGFSLEKIYNQWLESTIQGGTPGYFGDPVPEFGTAAFIITLIGGITCLSLLRRKK
ncbi:MAG: lamin tail domain-containing protein [Nanoarchaeota archaeon]|nr:lamin tail domain-containing protein [Nanoarchaeota archaeon]